MNNFSPAHSTRHATLNVLKRTYVDNYAHLYEMHDQICARWYVTVAPMNDIALSTLNDAVEQLKASPKWKKKGIRKSCEDALRLSRRYEHFLYLIVGNTKEGDSRQYFMDYMDSWQDETKKDVDIFRISISNVLLRIKYKGDVELASWAFLAYNMLNLACNCFDAYFAKAKEITGKDFHKEFYDGRLTKIKDAFKVAASSFNPNDNVPLNNDEMCQRSIQVLCNRFSLEDTGVAAANKAYELNPELEENEDKIHQGVQDDYANVRKKMAKLIGLDD